MKTVKPTGTGISKLLNAARILITAMAFCASAFFFWAWYERFLRWDFNELGRFYDPETDDVYTEAGFIWIFPALFFLLTGLSLLLSRVRRRRNQPNP